MQKKIGRHSSITSFMPPKSGLSKFKPTIQTRTRNKTSHPGQVVNDAKQKRQSHEEMEKIRAEENRMQQEKEVEQAENIQKAADIEDRMHREDINCRSSNRQAIGQAPFRPPSTTNAGWGAEHKGLSDLNLVTRDASSALMMPSGPERQEPKVTDPVDVEESDSSGDEYAPPAYKDEGESEVDKSDSDSEIDAEVEDDEEKKTKKGKKPKPARADIIAKRNVTSASASLTSTARPEAKRKANYEYDLSFT